LCLKLSGKRTELSVIGLRVADEDEDDVLG
jgi:hypothetical protein